MIFMYFQWMKCYLIIVLFFISSSSFGQEAQLAAIRQFNHQHADRLLREYFSFLAIPNTASNNDGLQKNASFIAALMKTRGIGNVQLLNAVTPGVPPFVYGEVIVPGARQTLIFYAHYDGQPVNPTQWAKGLEPFSPKLFNGAIDKGATTIEWPGDGKFNNEWRIYARGASDDKAGVYAILTAYEALVKNGLTPSCNIKFFFEGEEEAGSPHLNEVLEKHKFILGSDLWIICDGPVHQSGNKQIVFGVRGDTHVGITVYASKRPLHSGHYGNWAPNPAMMLAKLLASMKDENGRVTIKGFYDDVQPLTNLERKALNDVPDVDAQMKKELGLSSTEMPGLNLSEAINLPSLNINGMQSGNTGKMSSNQVPTFATADIDLRLVLGNDYVRQQQKVVEHIRSQGFYITEKEPTEDERLQYVKIARVDLSGGGVNAQRTAMDLPVVQKVIAAVQKTTATPVVLVPTMGGTLPLYLFEKHLNAKTITVPIANHDNNQHAENENIRLKNFFDGVETMAALMLMK
jgi:acetylornithine deacetylase/succinyl-diaminopimelate desuccinylase-like protein